MLWMPPDAPSGQPYTCTQGLITQACTVTPEVEGTFTMSFRAVDDDFAVTTGINQYHRDQHRTLQRVDSIARR